MGRLTGIVMEHEGTHVIVLTSKGEFKRIKFRGTLPEIGEEITIRAKTKNNFISRIAWVAAAAAVLMLALMSPLSMFVNQPPEKAVAWVTVDINPSLELTVSDKNRVIEVTALNDDGKKLINQLEVVGMEPEKAIAALTEIAARLGYIGQEKENSVLISVSGTTKNYNSQKMETKLVAAAQSSLAKQHMVAVVQTVKVTPEFREQARKKEMSAGKYAVLIEAVNSGVLITEKEIKESSVTEAIKKAGGEPEEILQKAHEETVEKLPEKEKKYMLIAGGMNREEAQKGEGDVADPEKGPKQEPKEEDKQLMIKPIRNGGAEQTKPGSDPTGTNPPTEEPVKQPDQEILPAKPDPVDTNPNTDLGNFRERDNTLN